MALFILRPGQMTMAKPGLYTLPHHTNLSMSDLRIEQKYGGYLAELGLSTFRHRSRGSALTPTRPFKVNTSEKEIKYSKNESSLVI
ncbi:hypothetical protein AVEN_265469-1 [Araneus ventricosus]|uniref:Uncharacterized protein n=1 Tax=Araneus ventricosus TaxID=182803 RepID=A0A4Y2CGV3_ARAVE|nr:hypothetical protein AVEN_265469-1 [Araneus ventricosus]